MSFENGEKPVSVGPWGGQGGYRWDDGVYSTIRQLVIVHRACIDSIQIEYDHKGTSIWSAKHGGSRGNKTGNKTNKVKLDYPDEFLTSIRGHYGNLIIRGAVFVRSLTLESNRKTYGPFGVEQGTYFSFPMTGGKIVGFHGKSVWYIDAIGAYFKPLHKSNPSTSLEFSEAEDKAKVIVIERVPSKLEGPVAYGQWGGNGGTTFDDGIFTGVKEIKLSRNVGIVSFKVLYEQNGQAVWGRKHGGTGGFKNERIVFDHPYEILTHISGSYGPLVLMGPSVIKSLTFHTTKGKYGPFGEEQGTSFSTNMKEGKIVGFHGRKGLFIDAIGVHVIQGKVVPPIRSSSNSLNQSEGAIVAVDDPLWPNILVPAKPGQGPREEIGCVVIKEPARCGLGPWGGDGGKPWDDGVFFGIKQIYLTRAEAICSIQIEYDRGGQSVWSVKHGGDGGSVPNRVKLDYPNEVLICVCGYYGSISREEPRQAVKSLTFYTTRGKYGPFGEEIGTFFTSTTIEGKVVGFHGRSSFYLDAIGVHMQHWLGNQRNMKSSLIKDLFI